MAIAFFLAGAGTFDAQNTDQRYLRILYKYTGKVAGLEHVLNSVADAFVLLGLQLVGAPMFLTWLQDCRQIS